MRDLQEQLRSLGPVLPTKCWAGPTPASAWGADDEHAQVVGEAFRHLFDGGPCYDLDSYTDVDDETAFALIALSLQPPLLHILGQIGRDDRLIPMNVKPPDASTVTRLRAALSLGEMTPRAVCNVNETGAWAQVDPSSGDLRELLVIVYAEHRLAALYWGEPID